MSSAPISDVLSSLGLSQYTERFEQEGFDDWEAAQEMTESDLDILGVKAEHHRKILQREISLAKTGKRKTAGIESSATKRGYRRHPEPDRNAPVKPGSPYVFFSSEKREDLKSERLSVADSDEKLWKTWQDLTVVERSCYPSQASAAWAQYKAQKFDHEKSEEYREYQRYRKDFETAQRSRQHSDGDLLPVSPFDEDSRLPKLSLDLSIPSSSSDISSEECSTRPGESFHVSSSPKAMTELVAAGSTMNDGSSKARKQMKATCQNCRDKRIACDIHARLPCRNCNFWKIDCKRYIPRSEFPQIFADHMIPFEKTQTNFQSDDSNRVPEVKSIKKSEPIEKALSFTIEDSPGMIESQVLQGLQIWASGASLNMHWELLDFIENQYVSNEDAKLGSMITLSGTVRKAQATTCSEYVRYHWPSQGSTVISALQSAINSRDHKGQATSGDLEIQVDLEREFCFLAVQSKKRKVIAEVFQQAIWMGAALRASRSEQVQYSSFYLTTLTTWDQSTSATFSVTFDTSKLSEDEQSCWLPLFANPVIAQGFPVSERENGERGLEIPLEIMAALGGARHVTDFQGGLVLKGHSAIFVPVTRHHQSIQWHLIRRSGEQRVLYREVVDECPKRAMLEEVDHGSLRTTRAFLGWWKNAETHLGTTDAAYDRIDWSPTSEARRSARISGANIGFQTMITGQLSFIMGAKDGRLHFSQKGPFERIVQCAESTPVVLYDSVDRRAWLVPGLDLMLHIVQTRHRLSPYNIDGKIVELTPVIPKNGRGAAPDATAANRSRQLYERDVTTDKCYYFKDAILDIWSQMERLMEKEDSVEAHTGIALHGTMRSKLLGWEYMSLVHEKNYRRKEAAIAKSSGGWVDLINDIDALVLFATGFDDIIKPVSSDGRLCTQWRSLPKGKDFLAASVPIMELLYSEAGSRISRKHLSTTHLQWHRGSTLFEQCSHMGPDRCKCDRTQQIYHDSLFNFGRVRPPGKLEENGCVIFGQTRHSRNPIKAVAMREKAIYILPNTTIQDSVIAKNVSTRDGGIQSPSPPASFSQDWEEVKACAVRSPRRPPSPSSSSDDLNQGETVAKKERRQIKHVPTPNGDSFKGPNNSDDLSSPSGDNPTYPLKSHLMLRNDAASNEDYAASTKTVCPSKAQYTPVHAPKTIRHKAKFENCGHACTCTICSTVNIESPGRIELVCTSNTAPINSTNTAERRQQ